MRSDLYAVMKAGCVLAGVPELVPVSRGAAVDANVLRGHPARRVAGQEGDDHRYLGRLTESAECAHRLQADQELLALAGPVGLSLGGARADGVQRDPPWPELLGQDVGEL